MNKILIEVSVGELLDKISILEIKKEKIKDSDNLIFINDEYLVLTKQLDENITLKDELKKLYEELKAINAKLWDIENNKRMCEKHSDFGENFIKLSDIVEVWFDSGSTHSFVLETRKDLKWPASMYLEGSDQHRGWFHSSLLESCGTRGKAPFESILSHGFVVDGKGLKMSKSQGNVISPENILKKLKNIF